MYSSWALFVLYEVQLDNKACHWPSSFFFVVFMFIDQDEVEAYKHANQERGQYPAILTEQAWSIKNLLYGFPGIPFFLQDI